MAAGADFFVLWKIPFSSGWKYPFMDMLESYYTRIQNASDNDRAQLTKEALGNFDNELWRLLTPSVKKVLKKEEKHAD